MDPGGSSDSWTAPRRSCITSYMMLLHILPSSRTHGPVSLARLLVCSMSPLDPPILFVSSRVRHWCLVDFFFEFNFTPGFVNPLCSDQ